MRRAILLFSLFSILLPLPKAEASVHRHHREVIVIQPGYPEPPLQPSDRALVEIRVGNPNTQVCVNGQPLGDFRIYGDTQTFQTPVLDPSRKYHYTFTIAAWKSKESGWELVKEDYTVPVQAGRTTYVTVDYWGNVLVQD